jgi:hypothetical protein
MRHETSGIRHHGSRHQTSDTIGDSRGTLDIQDTRHRSRRHETQDTRHYTFEHDDTRHYIHFLFSVHNHLLCRLT